MVNEAQPKRSNKRAAIQAKSQIRVVEQISRNTGEKRYFAYDENYRLLATESRLDRISKRVQKLFDKYEWDFSLEKVDSNWTPPPGAEYTGHGATVAPLEKSAVTAAFSSESGLKAAELIADLGRMQIIRYPLDDWMAFEPHPLHRLEGTQSAPDRHTQAGWDTVAASNVLRCVILGSLAGRLYKINGHARQGWWQAHLLPVPETVIATVHKVDNEDELADLYLAVHGSHVRKAGIEEIEAASSDCNLHLTSSCLQGWELFNALSVVAGIIGNPGQTEAAPRPGAVRDLLARFKVELLLLDSISPPAEIFQPGVAAAALLTLSVETESLYFFKKLSSEAGSKRNGRPDPIEALLIEVRRLRDRHAGWFEPQALLCKQTLAALEVWNRSRQSNDSCWLDEPLRPLESLEKYGARSPQTKSTGPQLRR